MTTPVKKPSRATSARGNRPASASNSHPKTAGQNRLAAAIRRSSAWLDSQPGIDYLMIRILVFTLTGIGVVMVMSSSMTWSIIDGSTVWGAASRQAIMVGAGLVMFWFCLKITPQAIRQSAGIALVVAYLLLILVLIPGIGTGREEVGSQSWINLGFFTLQPSEVSKFGIAIFGAHYLANRIHHHRNINSRFVKFTGIAAVGLALILAEGDLGMAVSFMIVVVSCLYFAGVHRKWIIGMATISVLGMVGLILRGGFRSDRFHVYFDALLGHFEDTRGVAFQSYQGFLSLADGSISGVGLGQSRAKWFYLPEAHNDFIFAIIGEELGLWGGALVIGLFTALAFFGFRTARRAQDQFQSLLAATITAMVCAQAFVNIGYVVGLLPVTGIQLPMISAGGTSAIITLSAMGVLANIARHEPEAISATQSYGRPLFDRMLFIAEPKAAAQPLTISGGVRANGRRASREAFLTPAYDDSYDAARTVIPNRLGYGVRTEVSVGRNSDSEARNFASSNSPSRRSTNARRAEREARFGRPLTERGNEWHREAPAEYRVPTRPHYHESAPSYRPVSHRNGDY